MSIKIFYKKIFSQNKNILYSIYLVLFLILSVQIFLLYKYGSSINWNWTQTGAMGDTFGGMLSPIIGIFAGALTYMAFRAQIKANRIQIAQFKEQKRQFEKQIEEQKNQFEKEIHKNDIENKIVRFETKYFELIKWHNSIVEKFNVENKIFGKDCFVKIYDEYKFIYALCRKTYEEKIKNVIEIEDNLYLTNLSYLILFYGIEVMKSIKQSEEEFKILEFTSNIFNKIQDGYKLQAMLPSGKNQRDFDIRIEHEGTTYGFYSSYAPFCGHSDNLSTYYRNLFHTVKYVVENESKLFERAQSLEYLRTLRAQLSDYEQVLLYYNAISIGHGWIENKYLTEYKMIHNVPFNLLVFGIHPKEHPQVLEGIKYWENKGGCLFDWDEN